MDCQSICYLGKSFYIKHGIMRDRNWSQADIQTTFFLCNKEWSCTKSSWKLKKPQAGISFPGYGNQLFPGYKKAFWHLESKALCNLKVYFEYCITFSTFTSVCPCCVQRTYASFHLIFLNSNQTRKFSWYPNMPNISGTKSKVY